jgi:hypothetical protein
VQQSIPGIVTVPVMLEITVNAEELAPDGAVACRAR